MLMVSTLPRSESCCRLPTASDGMTISEGMLLAVSRCRVNQPVPVLSVPGVPNSMNPIESKWDRLSSCIPAATTTATLPL
jgi:hypothetical protein